MRYDEEYEKILEKVLHHKYIVKDTVRPRGNDFWKAVFLGASEYELAERFGYDPNDVKTWLNDPGIKRYIKKINKMIEKELIRLVLRPLKEFYSHWEMEGKELVKKIKGRKPILGKDKAILFLKRFEKMKI